MKSIRLICLLGEGAFAKVFLIKKQESRSKKENYYAMKVMDKKHLYEKNYFHYIMLEKELLHSLDHPFILKLHYSFQCK